MNYKMCSNNTIARALTPVSHTNEQYLINNIKLHNCKLTYLINMIFNCHPFYSDMDMAMDNTALFLNIIF